MREYSIIVDLPLKKTLKYSYEEERKHTKMKHTARTYHVENTTFGFYKSLKAPRFENMHYWIRSSCNLIKFFLWFLKKVQSIFHNLPISFWICNEKQNQRHNPNHFKWDWNATTSFINMENRFESEQICLLTKCENSFFCCQLTIWRGKPKKNREENRQTTREKVISLAYLN